MKIFPTDFQGLLVLEPELYHDERGYFMESYSESKLGASGVTTRFLQDNQSFSGSGVIRGLHYQVQPHVQAKLVRVLHGTILDIVVDLRSDQPTYRKTHAIELSSENRKQLFIPKGFAHGFSVQSRSAEVLYKCDDVYAPECERGIRYDDPDLKIDWRVEPDKRVISAKDQSLPFLRDAKPVFMTQS